MKTHRKKHHARRPSPTTSSRVEEVGEPEKPVPPLPHRPEGVAGFNLFAHRHLSLLQGRKRSQFFRAVLIGIFAGSIAVLFHHAIQEAELWRAHGLERLEPHPGWGWAVFPLISISCGLFAAWLTHRFAPEASGSGIPHVKAVVLHLRQMDWKRILPVKFFGGVMAIGSGFSLGREGPTIQIGAAVGKFVADLLHVSRRAQHYLISAGGGAGLAAAFNAPLAGFFFVIEELQRELSPITYGTALIAAIIGDTMTRTFSGQLPAFLIFRHETPLLAVFPAFILVGLGAGGMGILFNRFLLAGVGWLRRHPGLPFWRIPLLAGLAVGLVMWWLPEAVGGGQTVTENLLNGSYGNTDLLGFVLVLLLAKFLLTLLCYFSGVPGGIFAPSLLLGALSGLAIGMVGKMVIPSLFQDPTACAVVGMAAFFAAMVRAPITGIVLILEMTANYNLLFPMLVATTTAFLLAESLGVRPIYDGLMDFSLSREKTPAGEGEVEEPVVIVLSIEPNSVLDGRMVHDLHLPRGNLVATIHRAGHDFVPDGETVFRGGDETTWILSGDVSRVSLLLHECSRSPLALAAPEGEPALKPGMP